MDCPGILYAGYISLGGALMGVLKTVPHSAKEAAQILHNALVGTGLTIATAESLTGGDVGGTICTVAGASEYRR